MKSQQKRKHTKDPTGGRSGDLREKWIPDVSVERRHRRGGPGERMSQTCVRNKSQPTKPTGNFAKACVAMPTSGSQNVCLQVNAFDIGRERRQERVASVWKISVHVTRDAFEEELV